MATRCFKTSVTLYQLTSLKSKETLILRNMAVKTKYLTNNVQSRNSALFLQPEVRQRIHNWPPLAPKLCTMNVIYNRTPQFLNIGFNITLITSPVLPLFAIQIYKHNRPTVHRYFSHLMHAACPCHLFLLFPIAVFH